jgi:hypothetical protein
LDTVTVSYLFPLEKPEETECKNCKKCDDCKEKSKKYVKMLQDDLWKSILHTEKKVFRDKHYTFNHSILTDGVGCSILFIRTDLYDPLKVVKLHHMTKPYGFREFQYVDDLTDEEKKELKDKILIGIDPGKIRLISATNGKVTKKKKENGKEVKCPTQFTYSNIRRKHETKIPKYKKIIENARKNHMIDDNSVEEIESSLSNYSSKSCNFKKCTEYITEKNRVASITAEFYEEQLLRRLRWYSYINKCRAESKMLNRFEEKFGKPKDVVLLYGDWSEAKTMRNQEPTKGIGMRRAFKKRGYTVLLVHEYNTSKKNFITGEKNETFKEIKDSKTDEMRLVHGLLRPKGTLNDKSCPCVLLNRDLNGSMNILKKGSCILKNEPVPIYLRQ